MGTESSAGFGDAVLACGGTWTAPAPEDENLDEIFENHEPLLDDGDEPGEPGLFSSLELLLE